MEKKPCISANKLDTLMFSVLIGLTCVWQVYANYCVTMETKINTKIAKRQ